MTNEQILITAYLSSDQTDCGMFIFRILCHTVSDVCYKYFSLSEMTYQFLFEAPLSFSEKPVVN